MLQVVKSASSRIAASSNIVSTNLTELHDCDRPIGFRGDI